jgi:hypothetical protein
VAISYSTDGSAWTPYTANSVVTLGSTPANFYIRFTFTGAGSFYGYSLFSSSSTPPATASSIMLDSSGFTGNLSTLTKNVQALAVVVDTLKTPSTPIFPATNRNLVKNKVHIYKSNSSDGSLDFILPSSGLVLGDFVDLHISTSNTATLRIIVSGGVGFTGPDNAFVSAYTIPKPITIGGVSATYHLHGVFAKCVFDGTYWLIASVSV